MKLQVENRGFAFVEILAECPTHLKMTPLEAETCVKEVMTGHFPLGVKKDVAAEPWPEWKSPSFDAATVAPEIGASGERSEVRRVEEEGQVRMNLPIVIQELEAARRLYTADFMEEDLYDDWASMERENLREMYLDTLDRLSDCYVLTINTPAASVLCEKILEKANCREDIHRRLMVCYYRLGSRNKALRQFKKCEEILKAELEVVPTKPTRQLYEEIRKDRLSSSLLKHLTNL